MIDKKPLVTVLTPVYNGEKYLAECIESVLNQDYMNWEYIIVNNCSTDSTPDIVTYYANIDPRIRLVSNSKHVIMIENHNIAFSLISPNSKYCKVVSADDWINADCITKMTELAEAHPTVGIIGSYQLSNNRIRWNSLPHNTEVISGREACRLSLLNDEIQVFGPPTSVLYRADVIFKNSPFFPHLRAYADISACHKYLQYYDYGLVHKILSHERIHDNQISFKEGELATGIPSYLDDVLTYGKIYLTEQELAHRKKQVLQKYYRYLGGCILKLKEREFWQYHMRELQNLGYPIKWSKVMKEALIEIVTELHHPRVAFDKLSEVINQKKYRRHRNMHISDPTMKN
jgi:glycosyltransferase involved in cell wall biosynthesis